VDKMIRELIEQVVGPEFKLQYCQGKERKKEEERKKELKYFLRRTNAKKILTTCNNSYFPYI
jgi:hypothetical protein